MFAAEFVLLAITMAGSSGAGSAASQASTCGPLSFSQMASSVELALAHVDSIANMQSKLTKAVAARVMCSGLNRTATAAWAEPTSAESTSESCLSIASTSLLGAQCRKISACSVQLQNLNSLCLRLKDVGCKPDFCESANSPAVSVSTRNRLGATASAPIPPIPERALLGCFDVRSSANATAAVRNVFGLPTGPKSSVRACAVACAASLNFAMENSRCLCADGLVAGSWPEFAVDPSQCGGACEGETLPCGRAGRLAIYLTAESTELLADGGRLAIEQGARSARAMDGARSSVVFAAAALSTFVFSILRAGYTLTRSRKTHATCTPLV
ncbi:hypothetical protein T492DRAFT_1003708 [Pavlovales sp. CCMP2436]|nr:hypothetical protein T492DRAFT_1003708 [Pavlovales sp. CCMP2436]|mmetsp:Transcript_43934/g.108718  ORF Transcript_43934/g.108718 Transcript_43934/m.108718 type:complete len:328 (-) Transcript_43934:131-1114(-)